MKLLPLFAMAAIVTLSASPAVFAKDCGARPAKPAIPDGKTASDDAMKAAQGKVASYITAVNAYRTCLAGETASATDEAKAVSEEWKTQSDIFVHTPKAQ